MVFVLIGLKIYGVLLFKHGISGKYKNLNNPIAQLTGKVVDVVAVKGDKMQVAVGDTVWPAVSNETFSVGEKAVISGRSNNVVREIKKLLDKKEKVE